MRWTAPGPLHHAAQRSPYGGAETDALLTVARPEGLFYMVFIAPERQFRQSGRGLQSDDQVHQIQFITAKSKLGSRDVFPGRYRYSRRSGKASGILCAWNGRATRHTPPPEKGQAETQFAPDSIQARLLELRREIPLKEWARSRATARAIWITICTAHRGRHEARLRGYFLLDRAL